MKEEKSINLDELPPIVKSGDIKTFDITNIPTLHQDLLKITGSNNKNFRSDVKKSLKDLFTTSKIVADFVVKLKDTNRVFIVEIPPKLRDKNITIEDFCLKKGKPTAQLKGENKYFGPFLSIKELKGDKADAINSSLNNMMMLNKLNQISNQLEEVKEILTDIKTEINNDRIAKINTGFSRFLDAFQGLSKENRDKELDKALDQFHLGREQLIKSIETSMNKIKKGGSNNLVVRWNAFMGKSVQSDVDSLLENLFYVVTSSIYICAIHAERGEKGMMKSSVRPLNNILALLSKDDNVYYLEGWTEDEDWKKKIIETKSKFENLMITSYERLENSHILELN